MSHRFVAALTSLIVVLCISWLASGPAAGQAFYPKDTPKFPQARTWLVQKAKLPPYTAPRTPDGVPDLQGRWGGPIGGGNDDIEEHEYVDATTPAQESYVSDPPDGKIPYTPWALAKRNEIRAGLARGWPGETGKQLHVDPASLCLVGLPRAALGGYEIVQKPGYVILLGIGISRVIPTDGRVPINPRVKLWHGNSRGRWEGDTLVVQVTGLNARTWIDSAGNFISENTRIVERWRLVDANTIDYEMTFEDPTIYTRPWKMNIPRRRAGTRGAGGGGGITAMSGLAPATANDPYANETWEAACYEGNHHLIESVKKSSFTWFRGVTPPQ